MPKMTSSEEKRVFIEHLREALEKNNQAFLDDLALAIEFCVKEHINPGLMEVKTVFEHYESMENAKKQKLINEIAALEGNKNNRNLDLSYLKIMDEIRSNIVSKLMDNVLQNKKIMRLNEQYNYVVDTGDDEVWNIDEINKSLNITTKPSEITHNTNNTFVDVFYNLLTQAHNSNVNIDVLKNTKPPTEDELTVCYAMIDIRFPPTDKVPHVALIYSDDQTNKESDMSKNDGSARSFFLAELGKYAKEQTVNAIEVQAPASFDDDVLIRIFFEKCKEWRDQNQNFTDVSEIKALWKSYLGELDDSLRARATALTSIVLNEPQILPTNFTFIDALKAQLRLSIPDMLYYQYLEFYPRGRRPDELMGHANMTSSKEKITFTADKNANKELFENKVFRKVFASNKPNPFEKLLKYTHSMSDLDQEGTHQCIREYITLFQEVLSDLFEDPSLMDLLSASTVSRNELMKVLNMTCNQYLSYYLLERGGPTKADFCKIILPIFQKLEEGFEADLNVSIQDAAKQYIENFEYNCNLCIFDAITVEDRRRQQVVYSIAHYRNMGKDAASAMLEMSGYGPETDADELVANEYSMRSSTFTDTSADMLMQASLNASDSISQEVIEEKLEKMTDFFDIIPLPSEMLGRDDDEIIAHLFEKNILYLRNYNREKQGDKQCQIALHRLWDAYVADAHCPAWIKNNEEAKARLKGKINPDNPQLRILLTKEEDKDKSSVQAIDSSKGTHHLLADDMQAVAILWMYPNILEKVAPRDSRAFEGLLARDHTRRARLTCEWVREKKLTDKIIQYYQEKEVELQSSFDEAGRARAMRTFIPLLLETRNKVEDVYAMYGDVHLDLMIVDKRLLNIFDSIEERLNDGDWAEKDLLSVLVEMISLLAKDFNTIFRPATLFASIAESYKDIEGNSPTEKGNKLLIMTMVGYLQTLVNKYANTANKPNNQYCSVLLAALTNFLKSALEDKTIIASKDFYKDFAGYMTATFSGLLEEKDPRRLNNTNFKTSYERIGITDTATLTEKVLTNADFNGIPLSSLSPFIQMLQQAVADNQDKELIKLAKRVRREIKRTTFPGGDFYAQDFLTSFFNEARISTYLTTKLDEVGGNEPIKAMIDSSLPLHIKLALIASIAQKALEKWNLKSSEKEFYQQLQVFSEAEAPEDVTRVFTQFLKVRREVPETVENIETYIQRAVLVREEVRLISPENFDDDFAKKWEEYCDQTVFDDPLSVCEEIRKSQYFLNGYAKELRAAVLNSTQARALNSLTFAECFERRIQLSIVSGQPIRVEDLQFIGVPPTMNDVEACFKLILNNFFLLPLLSDAERVPLEKNTAFLALISFLENAVETKSVSDLCASKIPEGFKVAAIAKVLKAIINQDEVNQDEVKREIDHLIKANGGNKSILIAVVNYMIISAKTDYTVLDKLEKMLSIIVGQASEDKDLLESIMKVIFEKIQTLSGKVVEEVKASLTQVLANTITNAAKKGEKQLLHNLLASQSLVETSEEGKLNKSNEVKFEKEVAVIGDDEVTTDIQDTRYSYKQRLIMDLREIPHARREVANYFSRNLVQQTLLQQVEESTLSSENKNLIREILSSDLQLHEKLKLAGFFAKGICESDASKEEKAFCEKLVVFSDADANGIVSAFTKFLLSQGKVDNSVFNVDFYAQRNMLIQQNLIAIPEENFPEGPIRNEFNAWCSDSSFTDSKTIFQDLRDFQNFLNNNQVIIQEAIAKNSGESAWKFRDYFMAWVGLSINNVRMRLSDKDLSLIGVPPTKDEILACREEILSIPIRKNFNSKDQARYIKNLYECYVSNNYQSVTFKQQFMRWLDLAIQTKETLAPEISMLPTQKGAQDCLNAVEAALVAKTLTQAQADVFKKTVTPWLVYDIYEKLGLNQTPKKTVSDKEIIDVFVDWAKATSAAREITIDSVEKVSELWSNYKKNIKGTALEARVDRLDAVVLNTPQELSKENMTYLKLTEVTLLLSVPDLFYKKHFGFSPRNTRDTALVGVDILYEDRGESWRLTARKAEEARAFEDFVMKNVPFKIFDPLLKYSEPSAVFDKYSVVNCASQYLEAFEKHISNLLLNTTVVAALEAAGIEMMTVIEMLNERLGYYLDNYVQEKSVATQYAKFAAIISPVLRASGAKFIADSSDTREEVLKKYIAHAKINISLIAAPTITKEEVARQAAVSDRVVKMRSGESDNPEKMMRNLPELYDQEQTIRDFISDHYEFPDSLFDENLWNDVYVESENLSIENFLRKFYRETLPFFRQFSLDKLNLDICHVTLNRLLEAFISDIRLGGRARNYLKDNSAFRRQFIGTSNEYLQEILQEDRKRDGVFDAQHPIVTESWATYTNDNEPMVTTGTAASAADLALLVPELLELTCNDNALQAEFQALYAENSTTQRRICAEWMQGHLDIARNILDKYPKGLKSIDENRALEIFNQDQGVLLGKVLDRVIINSERSNNLDELKVVINSILSNKVLIQNTINFEIPLISALIRIPSSERDEILSKHMDSVVRKKDPDYLSSFLKVLEATEKQEAFNKKVNLADVVKIEEEKDEQNQNKQPRDVIQSATKNNNSPQQENKNTDVVNALKKLTLNDLLNLYAMEKKFHESRTEVMTLDSKILTSKTLIEINSEINQRCRNNGLDGLDRLTELASILSGFSANNIKAVTSRFFSGTRVAPDGMQAIIDKIASGQCSKADILLELRKTAQNKTENKYFMQNKSTQNAYETIANSFKENNVHNLADLNLILKEICFRTKKESNELSDDEKAALRGERVVNSVVTTLLRS